MPILTVFGEWAAKEFRGAVGAERSEGPTNERAGAPVTREQAGADRREGPAYERTGSEATREPDGASRSGPSEARARSTIDNCPHRPTSSTVGGPAIYFRHTASVNYTALSNLIVDIQQSLLAHDYVRN